MTAVVVGAGVLAAASGCTTFQIREQPTATVSEAPIPQERWPARRTTGLEEKARLSIRDVVDRLFAAAGLRSRAFAPIMRGMGRAALFSGVYGEGILRVYDGPSSAAPAQRATVPGRTVLSMRFYSFSQQSARPADARMTEYASRQMQALRRRLEASGETLPQEDAEFLRVMAEGTAVRVIQPPTGPPGRGTIVYMAGLGSADYEQALVDDFVRRGWWMVKIATPRVWWYESRPWFIGSREDVPAVAAGIAAAMDDIVAEPAYTAEAALAYLREHRPEMPLSPLVMVGCSAGSLAAPAVVARMPDAFDAAILIGGGANLLEISQKSDLTDGGIHLAWPNDRPRSAWREELFKEYLRASVLDPYHTARFLRDKPTLIVQANLDITVPASNGWLLWDRAGRPDRYVHIGEHRTMFYTLAGQSDRIADWLESNLASRGNRRPITPPTPAVSVSPTDPVPPIVSVPPTAERSEAVGAGASLPR